MVKVMVVYDISNNERQINQEKGRKSFEKSEKNINGIWYEQEEFEEIMGFFEKQLDIILDGSSGSSFIVLLRLSAYGWVAHRI